MTDPLTRSPAYSPTHSRWHDWHPRGERLWLALAALLLAGCFFNPTLPWQSSLFEHVIVLDVTQSMNVMDQTQGGAAVSRLTLAKQVLQHALQDLPCGSRVGWAIFTETRSYLLFTPVEVCANRAELRASLAGIDGRMAWSGNSEVAKALHSGITVVKALPGVPSLVFITDGQEAPPLNARHRPQFDDKAGEVAGLIVGVGDLKPSPIPKTDPSGRPLGFWSADEVQQVDPRSLGRGASVGSESLVEDSPAPVNGVGLGATPGSEHLSALRETYLKLLASEGGFAYHRLHSGSQPDGDDGVSAAFSRALRAPALARPVSVRGDARLLLAALAFVLLLLPYAMALWTRLQRRPAPPPRNSLR